MNGDHTSGNRPLSPQKGSIGDSNHHSTSNGTATNGTRTSQETLRREPSETDSLLLPEAQKLAPIQILSHHDAGAEGPNGLSSPAERMNGPASNEPSSSRSRTASPAPRITSRSRGTTPADYDDEDVWEDEEDSILLDEQGNIIYEGPDYQDSASDSSDDADADELNQNRRDYRQATQQYRKSRRALILSGMSSFASSPSEDEPNGRHETSASPSSSIYGERQGEEGESYYQPHLAEAVDSADAGGRADGIRYDYDSAKEHEENAQSRDSGKSEGVRVKEEARSSDEDLSSPEEQTSHQTPQALDLAHSNGQTLAPPVNGSATRPPLSPRTTSAVADLHPSTPGLKHRSSGLRATTMKEAGSQNGLAPSPLIFDNEGFDPSEAFMTPRLSLTMLHEESKFSPLPRISEPEPESHSHSKPNGTTPSPPIRTDRTPFSLWDYLKEEVLATDFDATQEMKWERVTNFISIPFWMEKIIMFGFVVCLDSFLYTFTILPLRFGVAMWIWLNNSARWILGGQKRYLQASQKCDILKMLLIVLSCGILSRVTDASKMYHSVRGQDVVKLSVIFNVLEIADRLCCSFGQDLLDSLFSRSTLARRKNGKQPYLRPIGFFALSLCYVLAHTLVLFYQLVTLNVAINSYDNALLTLLLSNQFVEIKSSVFKKFEKENVFQMTCADIVERFQLTLMLSAIGLRNLIELSGGSLEPSSSPLPASFTVFPSLSLLETVLTPVCIVLASECIVDWLKHAFITKFNHIRPAVYGRFMDVLCRDLVVGGPSMRENSRKHTFVDQSPIISRRLGFAALPLACLLVRLILQIIGMIGDTSHIDECIAPINPRDSWIGVVARKLGAVDIDNSWVRAMDLFVRGSAWALTAVIAWAFLVAIKLLLGTNLVSFASHRYATMHERENEESLNARDRAPIGTNKDERSYDKSLGRFIDRADDDAIQIKLDGTHVMPMKKDKEKGKGEDKGKKESSLMEVSRYNMIRSRIW